MRRRWLPLCCAALGMLLATGPFAAAEKAENVYPAAILPFQERGDDAKGLGAQVTDLLFASLVADERMYLVDREDLDTTLKELELNRSGMVKSDEAVKVGQFTGAKVLLTGSVIQIDGKLYLVAKMIGTETTRVLGASVKGRLDDELDILAEQLADEIAKTIEKRSGELIAKPETLEDRLAAVKKALGRGKRPVVRINVSERHVGQPAIDPAATTEIALFCKETGFEVIDSNRGDGRKADVLLVGEGFSEFAARHGNLTSVKARLELKAVDAKTGRVIALDRQTSVEVDLTEQIAGKAALQEAAAEIAQRLLPKLVKGDAGKKVSKKSSKH